MLGRLKRFMARDQPTGAIRAAGSARTRILMVCHGNICRSPLAQGVLRVMLKQAGLDRQVQVDSAGTHGYHSGEGPDPRAIRRAARRGYDISDLRARPVVPGDFTAHDWLLAMDDDNLAWLQRKAPAGTTARIELLLVHGPGMAQHVPDPYYGTDAGFDHVLDLIEPACAALVAQLKPTGGELPPSGEDRA
jgi:protein-tyrosine phosphatase